MCEWVGESGGAVQGTAQKDGPAIQHGIGVVEVVNGRVHDAQKGDGWFRGRDRASWEERSKAIEGTM